VCNADLASHPRRRVGSHYATFRDWKFTTADFETIRLAPNDFVYADPPYDVEFTTYSKGGFSWKIRCARPNGSRTTKAQSFS
jgi:site-specific DNA-adenine methylase